VILGRAWEGRRTFWAIAWSFAFAGIVIGSLRPVNTWDLPTYLAIGALAVGYAILHYGPRHQEEDGREGRPWLLAIGGVALLALLSVLSFQPYADWYRQGYTSVQLWTGSRTPSSAYLAHWGIFLFFIVTWMAWETRQWLAATPLSSLRKLQPYTVWIAFGALSAISIILGMQIAGIYVVWLALPLMLWAGLLLLRPGQKEAKRLVLFLVGTGLFLSLMVEIIVLRGDISRMNTVFKFYMQIWVLFGVSAALALAWILSELRGWLLGWRGAWQLGAVALLACGALFLFLGGSAKMRDRFAPEAPHTLDGLSYMDHAIYYDKDTPLVLAQDRAAIRWLQENVEGSPTIVEAHTGEYKWGSRISINTGLPAVIGWNWHQRQQREFVPGNDVWGRVREVEQFYVTEDTAWVEEFLNRYQVRYIVVGQLERAYFPGAGLDKFEGQDGLLWTEVFRLGDTVIYEVNAAVLAAQ
jgi:YYY domain-containing protein